MSITAPFHYGFHSLQLLPDVRHTNPALPASLAPADEGKGKEKADTDSMEEGRVDESSSLKSLPGEGRAWLHYCKGGINYAENLRGTAVLALWERKPGEAESGSRRLCERSLREWVQSKGLGAGQVAQRLVESLLAESGAEPWWSALLRSHEGLFLISDHPGRVTVICSPAYTGGLRFYTSDPANASTAR